MVDSSNSAAKCFVKVVAIGDSGVGKTSLIQMFETNSFTENFKPTIGADFSNKEIIIDGRVVTLQIWDTAGQERYQSLGSAFYRGADCCCLVYDITNPLSFENLMKWKGIFLQKAGPPEPLTFPFLVIGNKVDLADEQRQVSHSNAARFCQEEGDMMLVETSARNNVNVETAFKNLATLALKRQSQQHENLRNALNEQTKSKLTARQRLEYKKKKDTKNSGCKC